MSMIKVEFPGKQFAEIPLEVVNRETGEGLKGTEYLECIVKDQAAGAPPRLADRLSRTVVIY